MSRGTPVHLSRSWYVRLTAVAFLALQAPGALWAAPVANEMVVASTGLEGPEFHKAAINQQVARVSLPDFPYAKGYASGITHYLRDNGVFWSVLSERRHPDKRDTEGDIVVLDDGSLLLAWSDFYTEGWHDGAPCRISMRRSTDGGRTWSPIEVLQEQIGSNVMSVSLLRTSRGTVLFTFFCKDGPDGSMHYVRRSTDRGKTFGHLIPANVGHARRVANNDRFLELRDPQGTFGDRGRILLSCRDYPGRKGVMVYSDDDGLTWQAGGHVPVAPEWGGQNFNEPGVVELDDGRLWMYGRTTMGFHAQAWSEDRGMTWSKPEPTRLRGPCSPLTGERIPATPYTKRMGWAGDILFTFPITISTRARASTPTPPAPRSTPLSRRTAPRLGGACAPSRRTPRSSTGIRASPFSMTTRPACACFSRRTPSPYPATPTALTTSSSYRYH